MNRYFQTPPVVKNLIIINVLVYMATALLPVGDTIMQYCALSLGTPYFHTYQFITYMFLHANFEHIFFNMFALWMFGRTLEYELGQKRFLTYYMVCGIGAALFMLYPASWFIPATIAVCAFWGIAIMTFNLVLQSLVIEVAPPAAVTIAMATYSGIYNLGIGSGAFIGGLVERSIGVQFTTLAGFLVSLVAAAVFFKKLLPNVMGLLKKEA